MGKNNGNGGLPRALNRAYASRIVEFLYGIQARILNDGVPEDFFCIEEDLEVGLKLIVNRLAENLINPRKTVLFKVIKKDEGGTVEIPREKWQDFLANKLGWNLEIRGKKKKWWQKKIYKGENYVRRKAL